jgi:hypothetical protein
VTQLPLPLTPSNPWPAYGLWMLGEGPRPPSSRPDRSAALQPEAGDRGSRSGVAREVVDVSARDVTFVAAGFERTVSRRTWQRWALGADFGAVASGVVAS